MASQNPTWTRDELILALDLYARYEGNPPGKTSPEIIELSKTLNAMGQAITGKKDDYRNPNGVYMKAMNFRRFDPKYEGTSGLRRGGKGEQDVWDDFSTDLHKLRTVAETIIATIDAGDVPQTSPEDEDDTVEAEEGRLLTRVHRQRERSRFIINKKKAAVLAQHGKLTCEACGFDFQKAYGERGTGFIEVHHTKPVHTLKPGSKTSLSDLVLLCSNCHRMVHAKRPWLSLDALMALIKSSRQKQS